MGLLKRAASICFILQQSSSLQEIPHSQHDHGLLYKTLLLIKDSGINFRVPLFWRVEERPETNAESPSEPGLEKLEQKLSSSAKGIIAPYIVFKQLTAYLGVKAAALFLFSRLRNGYFPWIYSGVSPEEISGVCCTAPTPELLDRLSAGEPITGEAGLLPVLFENQERLPPFLAGPVVYRQNLVALFIVFYADRKIGSSLNAVCRTAARHLYREREALLSTFNHLSADRWRNRRRAVETFYRECRAERIPLYVLVSSFKKLSRSIQSRFETTDPDCFIDDQLLLINSLLHGIGIAYEYNDQKIVIFFKAYNSLDPGLLLHQIFAQVKRLYGEAADEWKLHLPEKPSIVFEDERDLPAVLADYA
jgi:hypothetical protein